MWKVGCSGALYSILNREFGYPMDAEERASSALSGGIMQTGNQCGMLWVSSLAAGAESLRWYKDRDQTMGLAVKTTQELMKSYSSRTRCITGWKEHFSELYQRYAGQNITLL